jgi:hypothetical protein
VSRGYFTKVFAKVRAPPATNPDIDSIQGSVALITIESIPATFNAVSSRRESMTLQLVSLVVLPEWLSKAATSLVIMEAMNAAADIVKKLLRDV